MYPAKQQALHRDLEAFLQAGYRLEKACCVDQFCQTVWTEAVALLVKEQSDAEKH